MKSVLIANRGEIAVRIIRACKDHGLKSIAVYSDEDRGAIHTLSADAAYSLNGLTAAQTYLDIAKIIEVANGIRSRCNSSRVTDFSPRTPTLPRR